MGKTIYIFDTSVLLNVSIRSNSDVRKMVLSKLKELDESDEILYSNRVLQEFQKHTNDTPRTIQERIKSLKEVPKNITKVTKCIESILKSYKTLPEHFNEGFLNRSQKLEEISEKLKKISDENEGLFQKEVPYNVHAEFEKYFLGKLPMLRNYKDIIEKYEWITEGFSRIGHNIAPAYMDSYNKTFPYTRGRKNPSDTISVTPSTTVDKATNYLGDFFIWKEILNSIDILGSHVVFVTADMKSDWFDSKHDHDKSVFKMNTALKEEFKASAERKNLSTTICFLPFSEWIDTLSFDYPTNSEQIDTLGFILSQKLSSYLLNQNNLENVISLDALEEEIKQEIYSSVSDEILSDSGYVNGMYSQDVSTDILDDIDLEVTSVDYVDDSIIISGKCDSDASIYIEASEESGVDEDGDEFPGMDFNYTATINSSFEITFSMTGLDLNTIKDILKKFNSGDTDWFVDASSDPVVNIDSLTIE